MQLRATAFVTSQIGIPLTAQRPCISAKRRAPFPDSTICCFAWRCQPCAYLGRYKPDEQALLIVSVTDDSVSPTTASRALLTSTMSDGLISG